MHRISLFWPCFFWLICFLNYGNTLHNEFLMDDYPMLIHNTKIQTTQFLQLDPQTQYTQIYLRPITHLWNFISYTFFGENPAGYHLLNMTLLYCSGLALYVLLGALKQSHLMRLFTVVFFYVHPIQNMLINYKNATGYPFMILAFLMSMINFLNINKKEPWASLLGTFWFLLALLCHEIAVLLPVYFAALLYTTQNYSAKRIFFKCIPSLLVLVGYFTYRWTYMPSEKSLLKIIATYDINILEYIASYTHLIAWYAEKLFLPTNILLVNDFPLIRENTLLWCALFILTLSICFFVIKKFWKKNIHTMALMWIIIGCAPITLACFSRPNLGFIVQPHWLLFASIGFFILLGSCFPLFLSALSSPLFHHTVNRLSHDIFWLKPIL